MLDERFASGLSSLHPMGQYLTALHNTGFYYHFIGYLQIFAAVLLLIPRTVVLGAVVYFPVILNICVLSIALRFEGSFVTAPLMVLANLFLLVWHYDKLKFLLPFKTLPTVTEKIPVDKHHKNLPYKFFGSVIVVVSLTVLFFLYGYEIMPRNSYSDCKTQYKNSPQKEVVEEFCSCIHKKGNPLNECLSLYNTLKTTSPIN